MPAVRRAVPADADGCVAIVRGLPDYFSDDVAEKVVADLRTHPAWVVTNGGDLVGFAVVDRRSARAAEILWMAVAAELRGGGLGTLLLDRVLRDAAESGLQVVEVKTLDARAGYEPYRATRAFWERHGFVQVDTIDPLPGWQPGNPAAIYVAAIIATR
jgi:GNAT superfamily N-acetyltransferase